MPLPTGNPRIPEGINASEEHPLKEFALLALGVSLSLAMLVILISLAARVLAPYIPFAWEQKFNTSIAASIADGKHDTNTQDAQKALELLSRALVNSSMTAEEEAQHDVPSDAYRFYFMPMETPNAFATFGANIIVTSGLIKEVSSENGLAMVIAHEIAHVQLRHPIEAAGRDIVIRLALSGLFGSTGNNLLGSALNSGGSLALLRYSREMEQAADARALEILQAYYGHVNGADEFFLSTDEISRSAQWLEFSKTHPSSERRLSNIRAAIAVEEDTPELQPLPDALAYFELVDTYPSAE